MSLDIAVRDVPIFSYNVIIVEVGLVMLAGDAGHPSCRHRKIRSKEGISSKLWKEFMDQVILSVFADLVCAM